MRTLASATKALTCGVAKASESFVVPATRPPETACASALAVSVETARIVTLLAPAFDPLRTEPARKAVVAELAVARARLAPVPTIRPPPLPRALATARLPVTVSASTVPATSMLVAAPKKLSTTGMLVAVALPPAAPATSAMLESLAVAIAPAPPATL